jgi:hypothetical protein
VLYALRTCSNIRARLKGVTKSLFKYLDNPSMRRMCTWAAWPTTRSSSTQWCVAVSYTLARYIVWTRHWVSLGGCARAHAHARTHARSECVTRLVRDTPGRPGARRADEASRSTCRRVQPLRVRDASSRFAPWLSPCCSLAPGLSLAVAWMPRCSRAVAFRIL